ncbi:MAG: GNAT family N-acetyltransferase [Vicinamibacterales bacterium]
MDLTASLPTVPGDVVTLRQLAESDIDALFEMFGDADVVRYMSIPRLESREQATAFLTSINDHRDAGTLFQWGIVRAGDTAICGTCTLASIDREHERAELGFALGRRFRGTGLAHHAVSLLIAHAFGTMRLHRLEADVDPRNVASQRVLERLGFRQEGYQRERHLVAGERQDNMLYALLASEWPRGRPADDV